jgi:8-amino-7-oxononanoate synthase
MFQKILKERLEQQERLSLYRKRSRRHSSPGLEMNSQRQNDLSFCSNDYLGLANHPLLVKALQKGAEIYGVGTGGSHLISGYTHAHYEFEEAFAAFLQRDRAILFSNGYVANLGTLQALTRSGDIHYQDKRNHASLIDATLSSKAILKRYRHVDFNHLDFLLSQGAPGQKIIASDSVFSMDGDMCFAPALSKIAQKNQAWLMIDDAHGLGVLGKEGRGIIEYYGLSQEEVPILVSPLGKAWGCFGAIVSGCDALIENLVQFARPYIYTTGMPAALAMAAQASLQLIQTESWRREKLQQAIAYFKKGAQQRGLNFLPSDSAIQSFIIGNPIQTMHITRLLLDKGLFVSGIRPPSVPPHSSRLRITLNCFHENGQIDRLLDELNQICALIDLTRNAK